MNRGMAAEVNSSPLPGTRNSISGSDSDNQNPQIEMSRSQHERFSRSSEFRRPFQSMYPTLAQIKDPPNLVSQLVKNNKNGAEYPFSAVAASHKPAFAMGAASLNSNRPPAMDTFRREDSGRDNHFHNSFSESSAVLSNASLHSTTTSSSFNHCRGTVEIGPGRFKDVRGAEETMRYMRQNRCRRVRCVACDENLLCVDDCEMVICSKCRLISPLSNDGGKSVYGVGLGVSQREAI